MADLNDPTPPPARADYTASPPLNRAATGIQMGPNGQMTSIPAAAADTFTWRLWFLNIAAQVVVGLFIALLIALALMFFSGLPFFKAFGIGIVLSLVLTLLIQRWVTWPIPKEVLAKQHHLPPGVHPSESGGREVVETVVFVVVLVLLLKSFAAEAFVIPTGSMAETLFGHQKVVECPSCGHEFPVNCSAEVDPQEPPAVPIQGCTCPNCRQQLRLVRKDRKDPAGNSLPPRDGPIPGANYLEIADPGPKSGDRVLVGKLLPFINRVHRLDVVVFKYPQTPQKNTVPQNYIKRLIGMPGETIGIHAGDLYVLPPGKLSHDDDDVPFVERWKLPHSVDRTPARDLFEKGEFEILRKPPDVILSMMRLVYDNDHQANDLKGKIWQRWAPDGGGWKGLDETKAFHSGDVGKELAWLRYEHRLRENGGKPSLITDFMGYNSNEAWAWNGVDWEAVREGSGRHKSLNGLNWVGDLLLDCEVVVDDADGQLVLELIRGEDRFRAVWDLDSGDGRCTLYRAPLEAPEKQVELDSRPTKLRTGGTYRVRFANFDQRLTVWVDSSLPFDDGVTYSNPKNKGATAYDLRPVSIGTTGNVTVRKLKVYRDTYYCQDAQHGDVTGEDKGFWTDPQAFRPALRGLGTKTLYVQPEHYLCLGDNSQASSDGRDWGLVPERLLLGRAVLVYYPFGRVSRIR